MEDKFIITEIDRIVMVGKDEYPEQKSSFRRVLNFNELIFHFSGYSKVYFGDEVLETKPNTIRFLPKGNTKRYDVFRKEHGECIFVSFLTDRPIAEKAFVKDATHNEKIGSLFRRLFATWVAKNEGYYFESVALLYRIFAELQKRKRTPLRHSRRIEPAIEIIHNDFLKEDLSIKRLASVCGIGESYFERLFKEKNGVSPKKYIIQLRINHASELLKFERYTVTQISEMSGFSDVCFFSRQFKEYMGITPTQFVKKYKSSK